LPSLSVISGIATWFCKLLWDLDRNRAGNLSR